MRNEELSELRAVRVVGGGSGCVCVDRGARVRGGWERGRKHATLIRRLDSRLFSRSTVGVVATIRR
jgi:hypothetical protein